MAGGLKLFGWEINRAGENAPSLPQISNFTLPDNDVGAVDIPITGGMQSFAMDFDGSIKTEADLITRYRELALQPEVDNAIDDIVNDAVITDDPNHPPVQIILDKLELAPNIKEVIEQEFNHIVNLLKFNKRGYEVFRQWYIDGRLYYYMIIDPEHPENGIQELRYVDALKLRKVREVSASQTQEGQGIQNVVNEYYLYNDSGFNNTTGTTINAASSYQNVRIPKDAIVHVVSGLVDKTSQKVLSYLQGAIKPLNMLRMEEDAAVIYRLVRAPERRVWYLEVGGLPKAKADQYTRDMMTMHKNKVTYDQASGSVRDDRRFLTMTDDYWIPTRDGIGTKVDTLPGGQSMDIEDINYFKAKLYEALKVPLSRIESGTGFNIGRPSEITRDELKFSKFIARLRTQFAMLFETALEKQLILKQVIHPDEWQQISQLIDFKFTDDNFFEELKNSEMIRDRAQTMGMMEPFMDIFFCREWAYKNIWQMNDDQIEEQMMKVQQDIEMFGPAVKPPADEEVG